jgi:UDP-glucose 4-epimerase
MDFVFVEDIARANLLAMQSALTDRAFNVASGAETSLRGLADALLRVMGREDLEVEHGPERAVNGVTRRLADTSAARRELGFEARIGLDEGLSGLVAWWQAERARGLAEAA